VAQSSSQASLFAEEHDSSVPQVSKATTLIVYIVYQTAMFFAYETVTF
jgi:hypothetical protein